jgi:hypothetical protein
MPSLLLPGGALGEVIAKLTLDGYDEETAKKDPEFYPKSHTELREAYLRGQQGKVIPLSSAAMGRLYALVRQTSEDTEVPAVREQAAKWLREHWTRRRERYDN